MVLLFQLCAAFVAIVAVYVGIAHHEGILIPMGFGAYVVFLFYLKWKADKERESLKKLLTIFNFAFVVTIGTKFLEMYNT